MLSCVQVLKTMTEEFNDETDDSVTLYTNKCTNKIQQQ